MKNNNAYKTYITIALSPNTAKLIKLNSILIIISLAISAAVETYNYYVTHYQGIVYVPVQSISLLAVVILIFVGLKLTWQDRHHYLHNLTFYLGFFILVLWALSQLTNAIQLTPFPIIDSLLHKTDLFFGIHLVSLIKWTNQYPLFKDFLMLAYASLNTQILIIPGALILLKEYNAFLKTTALLLLSSIVGFLIYYFFPTTGPASLLKLPLFAPEQFATGVKFNDIHQLRLARTIEGGLIAFPSFHTTWALVCQYALFLMKRKLVFYPMLLINIALILACPLLGWHYLIDVFAAFVLFAFVLLLCNKYLF